MVVPNTPTTWAGMILHDARLGALERKARECKPAQRRDWKWFESNVKAPLVLLVGFHARSPELRTGEAYEVAYKHLLRIWETGR